MKYQATIFCDGGVISVNPSPIGGTWSWIQVNELGRMICSDSGVVTPEDVGMKTVSNNLTELLAAVRAIASTPEGWSGVLYTDSQVTMHRLTNGIKDDGKVPKWLKKKAQRLRRTRRWRIELVKGHPNAAQLEQGWSGGRPVSKWNVRCDEECNRVAKEFLEGKA